ncbi:MAG TPA: ABC transporter permease [Vicinamibacteria bacterium]|jgi:phospholipid/cholesterol/gamma-HCH transport system permease protein
MNAAAPPTVSVSRDGGAAVVRLSGTWSLRDGLHPVDEVTQALEAQPPPQRLRLDAAALERWDTSLVVFLARVHDSCSEREVGLDTSGLPQAARRLLELARQGAVLEGGSQRALADRSRRERRGAERGPEPWTESIGWWAIHSFRSLGGKLDFLGSTVVSCVRMLLGRTRRLRTRFLHLLQQAGVETLPVVALMGFAIGAVLALITTGQLEKLGATPLVARIVSIAVLREMGALMVGIAIAGRLGAAIAAEIASMVAYREVDVLRVVGVDPFDYLVAPRVLALAIAGPLLVVYANVLGLLGGLFVGVTAVGLPAEEYIERTRAVLTQKHMLAGLIKGLAFGVVTGLVAAYYGLNSGRTAGAVGWAVRRAVVAAVVGVVLSDAAITLVFKWVRL